MAPSTNASRGSTCVHFIIPNYYSVDMYIDILSDLTWQWIVRLFQSIETCQMIDIIYQCTCLCIELLEFSAWNRNSITFNDSYYMYMFNYIYLYYDYMSYVYYMLRVPLVDPVIVM